MIEFKPGDVERVADAIAHAIAKLRQDARYRLFGAGIAIAKTTQAIGTLRHGQLLGRPQVKKVDDETVSVGFKAARARTVDVLATHLELAKKREWPRALNE